MQELDKFNTCFLYFWGILAWKPDTIYYVKRQYIRVYLYATCAFNTCIWENHVEIITSIKRCLKLSSSQLLSKTEGPFELWLYYNRVRCKILLTWRQLHSLTVINNNILKFCGWIIVTNMLISKTHYFSLCVVLQYTIPDLFLFSIAQLV